MASGSVPRNRGRPLAALTPAPVTTRIRPRSALRRASATIRESRTFWASPSMARQDSIRRPGDPSAMKAPAIDELVSLPEALAIQRHFDARNYRFFRWLLGWNLFMALPAI